MTFDRPQFNRMIAEIEAGNVATVIVKDMSRLGRDYLKVGYYTEIFFVERDVRYIAINDGVDSAKGDNDFTPFRNLFKPAIISDTLVKTVADLLNEIENEILYRALLTVDRRTLQIILLKMQGYSTKEISPLVGLTTGAIYARLDHLRKKLRKIL